LYVARIPARTFARHHDHLGRDVVAAHLITEFRQWEGHLSCPAARVEQHALRRQDALCSQTLEAGEEPIIGNLVSGVVLFCDWGVAQTPPEGLSRYDLRVLC
jgi:hypothetical protein